MFVSESCSVCKVMKCYKNSNLPYPEAFWDIFYQGVGLKELLMSLYCVIFYNFLNNNWQRPTAQPGMQRSWGGGKPRGVRPTSNLKCSSDVSAKFIWQLGQISTVFKTRFDHICHNKKILSSTYCPWVPWREETVYKPSESWTNTVTGTCIPSGVGPFWGTPCTLLRGTSCFFCWGRTQCLDPEKGNAERT